MVLPAGNDDLVMVYWGYPGYYQNLQQVRSLDKPHGLFGLSHNDNGLGTRHPFFARLLQCMGRGNDDTLWIPSLIGPSGGQRGSCVCIQFGTYKCAQFRLSQSTLKAGQNCGNILDVYSSTLISSASEYGR
jgi:hypothetical protein